MKKSNSPENKSFENTTNSIEKGGIHSKIREGVVKEQIKNTTRIKKALRLNEMFLDGRKYVIEGIESSGLTPSLIKKFSDFYLEIFRNSPYGQFIFHEDEPLKPISPQEAFGSSNKKYFSLDEMENFVIPPKHHLWVDRDKCLEINAEKLKDNAFISYIKDDETNDIRGLVFGRKASLKDIFKTEEMENPLLFSKYFDKDLISDESKFFDKMKYHFGVNPDDDVFYISCQAVDPLLRGKGFFHKIMSNFASIVPSSLNNLFFFGEVSGTGKSNDINSALTDRKIFGILENGHPIVSSRLSNFLEKFLTSRKIFSDSIRSILDQDNNYKYNPQNNSRIEIKNKLDIGRAVFAKEAIIKGDTIASFDGEKYKSESASSLHPVMVDHALQISENEYIHAYNQLAELLNHSCDPNCGVRGINEIFTLRDILPGEELTWDYRMTEDNDWVLDNCQCGSPRCSGRVEGFSSLPQEIKDEYIEKGAVSDWIRKKYGISRNME